MKRIQAIIRKAAESDIESVFRIESESLSLWKYEQFMDELEHTFSLFLVAEYQSQIIGYSVSWIISDEIQLNNIAVKMEFRRYGIATSLIEHTVSILKERDMKKIYLEVNEKNDDAMGFYEKIGFIKTGMRNKYYGTDSAVLMELPL